MSFLLLKSKSRSSRLTSYRTTNTDNRNPPIASRSQTNSSGKFINAGGGQIQLQRPQQQKQQKRQISSTIQQDQQGNKQQNDVISMDEVMEDLRVLEQQQRDSQRLLASIKLTKQHKLEQRVSLETKLSSLKYSNGEARAQLLRARDVLSKSTRELGSAKLYSERSSDNLKRFDDKLKRTLNHVRGLHAKRRQVERSIAKLRNQDSMLCQQHRSIVETLKCKETERDDAIHRQKLLLKTIQSSKIKTQELVEETMKMRTELSELESDLTTAQQMEASTKFRADNLKNEIATEKKRHQEATNAIDARVHALREQKEDIEQKVTEIEALIDTKEKVLNQAFNECIDFQKEDGLELSSSPTSAAIDIDRIQSLLENEESDLRVTQQEEKIIVETVATLEQDILQLKEKSSIIESEIEKLNAVIIRDRETEEDRATEREAFMEEYRKEESEVEKMRSTVKDFERAQDKIREDAAEYERDQLNEIDETRIKIKTIEIKIESLERDFESSKMSLDEQRISNKKLVEQAKQKASEKKAEFDVVQKEADKLSSTDNDEDLETDDISSCEEDKVRSLEKERAKLLSEFPCLAALDFTFDMNRCSEEQMEAALSDLRSACEGNIRVAQNEKERRDNEAKVKAAMDRKKRLCEEVEKGSSIELVKQSKVIEEEVKSKAKRDTQKRLRQDTKERVNFDFDSEEWSIDEVKTKQHRQKSSKRNESKLIESDHISHQREMKDSQGKDSHDDYHKRSKSSVSKTHRGRSKLTYGKRSESLSYENNRKRAESFERVTTSKSSVEAKERNKIGAKLGQVDDVKTKTQRKKIESDKASRHARHESLGKRSLSKLSPSSSSIRKKLYSHPNPEENTKSRKTTKSSSILMNRNDKSPKAVRATNITKRPPDHKNGKRPLSVDSSKRSTKIQKLDIFSSSKRHSAMTKTSMTTKGKDVMRVSKSKQHGLKTKVPSQSQATVGSRKSFSSARRRKHVPGTVGKTTTTSQVGPLEMDFSFM